MDKRWLIIILILIIGCGTLYLIVDNSNVVGKASVNLKDSTFTLPLGFDVFNSRQINDIEIVNYKTNMKIQIIELENNNSAKADFNNSLSDLYNGTEFKVIDSGVATIANITCYVIQFKHNENVSGNGSNNFTYIFFYKDNYTYNIRVWNFDYKTDQEFVSGNVSFIIDSLRINYKK